MHNLKGVILVNQGLSKAQCLEILNSNELYCITSEEHSRGKNNLEVVKDLLNAGVKIIQYREKEKPAKDKYHECLAIQKMCQKTGTVFIINDDIDIALLLKADGVHIGQDDLPLEAVRKLVGNDMLIGLSTHSPVQAQEAISNGADYLGIGPIFATSTKKDVSNPVGLEYLEYAANNIPIPLVAIGGIKIDNLAQVLNKGGKCIAMITEIVDSDDIAKKVRTSNEIIKNYKG